ncbi:choice-of-anchor D domain-containing protein [Paracoccus marinaquae]|uniref:Choice-of-anchor D domain-containing protein n=1 Tax=Paracoccus marinaquae TaxID=2841926 RepID=A0ABS6ANE1_9RHOB|nr:choice-of-anchor D domain-containing protein [Paracoccus marinaquae]MBU3032090.1 choice-of-anchor D domain-containing protein [Paracoccus marinaquae]
MHRTHDKDLNATVTRDDGDRIRSVNFGDHPSEAMKDRARQGPKSFLRSMAMRLGIPPEELSDLDRPASFHAPEEKGVQYRLSDRKTFFDTTTFVYRQTYHNTPVWGAGITVTVKDDDARILSMTDTGARGIDAPLPQPRELAPFRILFAGGEKTDPDAPGPKEAGTKAAAAQAGSLLDDILGAAIEAERKYGDGKGVPTLIRGRFQVYRYETEKRLYDHPVQDPARRRDDAGDSEERETPILPLPPVPKSIKDGDWRFVAELVVRFPYRGLRMNWRLLVDIQTHAVLYLRALASGANGLVFTYDPITSTGSNGNDATQGNAVLNPLRDDVVLEGLDPPVGGTQALSGNLVRVVEVDPPAIAAPTRPAGADFDFSARTDEFSAVNAYFHNDRFFRLVESLGFPLGSYFDGTSFPIDVDHRGFNGAVNAHCIGDGDGIAHTCYGLIDSTGGNVGIACDWGVVLHELGGHGILYDHVSSANFGFAHSAGDSFAMILNDYLSEWHNGGAIDRFALAPFPFPGGLRRSDRTVAAGWGWDGPNDVGSYSSEQILSTCMFRVYRSIGGDSTRATRREFAARMTAYLMLRAVGTLSPVSNPNDPALFLDALLTADAGDWTTEGLFGGAYEKVLAWSFEQQDLNDGAPPIVDVYIDDGRGGEYEYLPDFTDAAAIWNRRAPDGLAGHQEPGLGTNYAYVRVRNRGSSAADNVAVRGFHSKPLAGRSWPDDLQPMTTPELGAGTIQPNDAEEVVVGPFAWTPVANAEGHDSMMMIVSAPGDPSNSDKFGAGEEIEDWRLVPNDNNIAVRDVRLEPRLVTVIADSGEFGNVCPGSHKDMVLVLSNSGFGTLAIRNITSSSGDFLVPGVVSYPIAIASGDSVEVPIRFQPGGFGPAAGVITVFSNDPEGPRTIRVSGQAKPPRLVVIVPDHGDFGEVCPGSFADRMLILNNSGKCPLTIRAITSSSAEFVVAHVMSFPIVVGAGDFVHVPVRFQPVDHGAKAGTITIDSDDPAGKKTIKLTGKAPSGRLTITGSTCIGGVRACCVGERTIALCNTGKCALHVTDVGFDRKTGHWRLVNNPFPAVLHPGSCLNLLIRYKATEKCPKCVQLVIRSDDPDMPVRKLDLMAYTVWPHSKPGKSGCACDDDCGCGPCDDGCGVQSLDPCCFDEDCDENGRRDEQGDDC